MGPPKTKWRPPSHLKFVPLAVARLRRRGSGQLAACSARDRGLIERERLCFPRNPLEPVEMHNQTAASSVWLRKEWASI